jgi:hypothetical protein
VRWIYYLLSCSGLTGHKHLTGIPFNDTSNFRLGLAQYAPAILGHNLLGLQAGNEPDEYAAQNLRPYVCQIIFGTTWKHFFLTMTTHAELHTR